MNKSEYVGERKQYHMGYICGAFDMFHIGHLNILRRCKKYCDYLMVGVNSDEFIEVTKHKKTIISENDRMDIISELKCVDEVVLVDFHNSDTIKAWELYGFDVQFCGNDHEERLQETKKELQKKGADIVFFPYTQGVSSTMIRQRLKEER